MRALFKSVTLALAAVIAATCVSSSKAGSAPSDSQAGPCRPLAHGQASYVVCTIDLARYKLKIFLRGSDGELYGGFSRLTQSPEGRDLVFAMNAGMFGTNGLPIGLYIEGGRLIRRANTANGSGNFHLKPNGIFYARDDMAGVLETGRYLALKPRAELATQSGPMLVIDGKIHPKFSEDGGSRKLRNGVGVRDGHTAIFAISDEPVSFGEFAHLFRDGLGCANALFLDGSGSSLYAPSLDRSDGLAPMGPIIGAVERR